MKTTELVPLKTYKTPKLSRERYLDNLNIELNEYREIELTKEEMARVSHHLAKLATGTSSTVPLKCGGKEKCPFASNCPLVSIDKVPYGKGCLIENQLMKEFTVRYFQEFDIDPSNWTEVAYINELAEIDIYLIRLNMVIARPENAELVIDQVVAVTKEGIPILQKQIAPYVELKDKLLNRRSKVIKLMVGDRQEKYKKEAALKVKLEQDPSSKMAQMRSKLEELQRAMDSAVPHPTLEIKEKVTTPEDLINSEDG